MAGSFATLPGWLKSTLKVFLWLSIGAFVIATVVELTYITIRRTLPTTVEDVRAAERKLEFERLQAEASNVTSLAFSRIRAQEEIEAAKVEASRISLGLSPKASGKPTDGLEALAEIATKHLWVIIAIMAAAYAFPAITTYIEQRGRDDKLKALEDRLRENPEEPKLAWDIARVELENHLKQNLRHVRSIYWLTVVVMSCGFAFVIYGLVQLSQNPETLQVSIVASASGVLISFIGGSFLVIYRAILAQSKEYVTVLERINAVGMAVQIIASIPEDSVEMKSHSKAELAKQLLSLYTVSPLPRTNAKRSNG
jgi:hypothetical protein